MTADSADESPLLAALDEAQQTLGPPDVVVYNAAVIQRDALGELSADRQLAAWAIIRGARCTAAVNTPTTLTAPADEWELEVMHRGRSPRRRAGLRARPVGRRRNEIVLVPGAVRT